MLIKKIALIAFSLGLGGSLGAMRQNPQEELFLAIEKAPALALGQNLDNVSILKVKQLLSEGTSPNFFFNVNRWPNPISNVRLSDYSEIPLKKAISKLNASIVQLLLEYGADPSLDKNLLCFAAGYKLKTNSPTLEGKIRREIVMMLLDHPKINVNCFIGNTKDLLIKAIESADVELVEKILQTGQINAKAADSLGWTPLDFAEQYLKDSRESGKKGKALKRIIKVLEDAGVQHGNKKFKSAGEYKSDQSGFGSVPPGFSSAQFTSASASGFKPAQAAGFGFKPAGFGAAQASTCKPTFTQSIPISQQIEYAMNNNNVGELRRILIGAMSRVNLNQLLIQGAYTPLGYACLLGRVDIVRFLLEELFVDPNVPQKDGSTPLKFAVELRSDLALPILEILLDNPHIDVNKKDARGKTALMLATDRMSYNALKRLLNDHRIDVNSVDADGNTALHSAVYSASLPAFAEILKHPKININSKGRSGTPLQVALVLTSGDDRAVIRRQMVDMLRSRGAEEPAYQKPQEPRKAPPFMGIQKPHDGRPDVSEDVYKVLGIRLYASPSEILGILNVASLEEIRKAYIQKTFAWHPDKNAAPEAADAFKLIKWAYEKLSESKKRSAPE